MVNVGEKAPNFKANAIVEGKEKEISLEEFKGKKIVLYFYPRDMTPGCTTQACNIRDNFKDFQEKDIVVLGVSIDSIDSHKKFIDKKELPFILVADPNKEIVNKYGVWGEKSFMGKKFQGTFRKTFLINENQEIVHIIEKPKVGNHSEEIFKGFNGQ